jgi:hypothetical protein
VFNINEFKARMDRHGGPALNSLFVVEITDNLLSARTGNNIDTITTNDLRFFCQTVTVPGINLDVMQYRPTGVGFPEFMPMSSSPGALNCIFMLDTNHNVITYFHRWINSVINVGGNIGRSGAFGTESREINYKSEYTTSMVVKHFSAYGPENTVPGFYEYKFEGVYPTEVGGVTLSWSDGSPSTATVNFSYSRILHSGFQPATAQDSRFVIGSQDSIFRGGRIPQNIINETVLPAAPLDIR